MTKPAVYILDSDVLIAAKNAYYAFDICPGFWNAVLQGHSQRRIFSINRVRGELMSGSKTEDLVQWVGKEVPDAFFLDVDEDPVTTAFQEIMLWSQRHTRYFDSAKAKFATGADGWLVAYAKVHGSVVVTNEQSQPESKKAIKLPDVCSQFDVQSQNTFTMLRDLAMKFDLRS
jgi:hypothetical protein